MITRPTGRCPRKYTPWFTRRGAARPRSAPGARAARPIPGHRRSRRRLRHCRDHHRPVRSPGSGQGEALAGAATAAAAGLRHRRGRGQPGPAPRAARARPVVGYAVGPRHATHGRERGAGDQPVSGCRRAAFQGRGSAELERPAVRRLRSSARHAGCRAWPIDTSDSAIRAQPRLRWCLVGQGRRTGCQGIKGEIRAGAGARTGGEVRSMRVPANRWR